MFSLWRGLCLARSSRIRPSAVMLLKVGRLSTKTASTAGRAGIVRSPWDLPRIGRRAVGSWLLGCAGLTIGAVALGGATRIHENSPDEPMTLSQFKFIWYMEYGHRMWGRLIGVAFALPAAAFWYKGWLTAPMKPRVIVFGSLLLFQGLLGWYMVKSGLEDLRTSDVPRVSPLRLSSHLASALILYAGLFWNGLSHFIRPNQQLPTAGAAIKRLRISSHLTMTVIFLTAMSGALVAGLDAGLVYNSWPKMADRWIPSDLLALRPIWRNFYENATCSQFVHRRMAELSVAACGAFWLMARVGPLRLTGLPMTACHVLLATSLLQASLGIATLLAYVPTWLAILHQQGAASLLTVALFVAHSLRKLPK